MEGGGEWYLHSVVDRSKSRAYLEESKRESNAQPLHGRQGKEEEGVR